MNVQIEGTLTEIVERPINNPDRRAYKLKLSGKYINIHSDYDLANILKVGSKYKIIGSKHVVSGMFIEKIYLIEETETEVKWHG